MVELLEPLSLWLPKPPDNANIKLHHMVIVRRKNAYLRELDQRAAIRLIPKPPDHPFERVELLVEWHYPNRRHLLDDDNVIRRLKPACDWLVRSGYLSGDTSGHVSWRKIVTVIGAPTPPLSTVRLTLIPIL